MPQALGEKMTERVSRWLESARGHVKKDLAAKYTCLKESDRASLPSGLVPGHRQDEERLRVVLCDPSPGVELGGITDENSARAFADVVITGSQESAWRARFLRPLDRDLLRQHLL